MTADVLRLRLLLVCFAGWITRHQQEVIEYLIEENRDRRHAIRWMLLIFVVSGCAALRENVHEPGRLPTAEESCASQGGTYSAGTCHTHGGGP